jgi:hypothetical protein
VRPGIERQFAPERPFLVDGDTGIPRPDDVATVEIDLIDRLGSPDAA